MNKNNKVKMISQLLGILLCLTLIQSACAQPADSQKDLAFRDVTIQNVTIENVKYANGSYENVPIPEENETEGSVTEGTAVIHTITPNYYSTYLMAGNSENINVIFKNEGNETLAINPKVVSMPNSEKIIDESWITISPANATVEAGMTQEFAVGINIPKDAEGGYYQAGIAFTDDLLPNSTDYANLMRLDLSVQALSKIELQTTYLSDNVEPGQLYIYNVKIKNIIDRDVTIDPKINKYIYDISPNTFGLSNDQIDISAPSVIEAGQIANMTIKVPVPENATGYYNGYIDMNVDGKENDGANPQLSLYFRVIQQPTVPYLKTFNLTGKDPITIEVTADSYDSNYGLHVSPEYKEPSFEVGLKYKSRPVRMSLTKTTQNAYINIGQSFPIWAMEDASYQNSGKHYTETYTVPGKTGKWELSILPKNTENFGYTITIGKENRMRDKN